jgi:hypothetical protein
MFQPRLISSSAFLGSGFSRLRVPLIAALGSFAVAASIPPTASNADQPFIAKLLGRGRDLGHAPATTQDPAIEELAANIDWLEHQIDRWGSVAPKTPDIWGEARLTKYRSEVETELEKEVKNFAPSLNGVQSVNDQAFLAVAFALRSIGKGGSAANIPATSINVASATSKPDSNTGTANGVPSIQINTPFPNSGIPFGIKDDALKFGSNLLLEQTEMLDQKKRYLDHLNELRRINEGDDTSDSPGYALNLVRLPVSVIPGGASRKGYGAEITFTITPDLSDDLLPTAYRDFVVNDLVDQLSIPFTQFLNNDPTEARRMLYLIESSRSQVSSNLTDEARDNVKRVRDLIDRFHCDPFECAILRPYQHLFRLFNPDEGRFPDRLNMNAITIENIYWDINQFLAIARQLKTVADSPSLASNDSQPNGFQSTESIARRSVRPPALDGIEVLPSPNPSMTPEINALTAVAKQASILFGTGFEDDKKLQVQLDATAKKFQSINSFQSIENSSAVVENPDNVSQELSRLANALAGDLRGLAGVAYRSQISTARLPVTSGRRSTLAFPPSQLIENFGSNELAVFAIDAVRTFAKEINNRQVIHLTDVQAYLREELAAAYELMKTPNMQSVWESEAYGEHALVLAIRGRRNDLIEPLRASFMEQSGVASDSTTVVLAWCILVESILFNERMNEEVQNTVACQKGSWLPYFGPNPSPEARQSFNSYVAKKWPIRVFTVDPVNNEQNIADVSSIKRQMQLSVALAFAAGEVGASTAMQTMRTLQRDTGTIELNRTIVGFSHGENNFGWRFYPRFQTPPVEGNAKVLFRDLVLGGPTDNQLKRSQEIEPGMRECVAIIMMPSFVPSATIDSRSNWFRIDNPSSTAISATENVKLSRSIVAMHDRASHCVRKEHLYRSGELDRLLKRVQQLDAELPMQTLRCPVPIENTSGGFEILAAGTRELAPELHGWYGSPGYDRSSNSSTFFLIGDNLSVHQTKVVIGNKLAEYKLISRQVMMVTVAGGLPIVEDERLQKMHESLGLSPDSQSYSGFLDCHIATPYGVSGQLLIPALSKSKISATSAPCPPTTLSIAPTKLIGSLVLNKKSSAIASMTLSSSLLPPVRLPDGLGLPLDVATIHLRLSDGATTLPRVSFKSVPQTVNREEFAIASTQLLDSIDSDGGLFKAIKGHVDRLLTSNEIRSGLPVTYKANFSLEQSKIEIPVEGVLELELTVVEES